MKRIILLMPLLLIFVFFVVREHNGQAFELLSFLWGREYRGELYTARRVDFHRTSSLIDTVIKDPSSKEDEEDCLPPVEFAPITGVYTGSGSQEEGLEAFENFFDAYNMPWFNFSEEDIHKGRLQDRLDIIIFPGGFSEPYRYFIRDHGPVRDFVNKGGIFVGICAGAYYAADIMIWGDNVHDYPLNLFSGKAVSAYDLIDWGALSTLYLNLDYDFQASYGESLDMLFLDGPFFEFSEEQEVDVLAEYRVNGKPAIISFTFGEGKVLLLGAHPEMGYDRTTGELDLHGKSGAQWPWLYDALYWLVTGDSIE